MEKSLFSRQYRAFLRQLRPARAEAGLTQEQLARRLAETQSFVSKVERGEGRLDVVELRAFCRALGFSFPRFTRDLDETLSDSEERQCSKR